MCNDISKKDILQVRNIYMPLVIHETQDNYIKKCIFKNDSVF